MPQIYTFFELNLSAEAHKFAGSGSTALNTETSNCAETLPDTSRANNSKQHQQKEMNHFNLSISLVGLACLVGFAKSVPVITSAAGRESRSK
jgi:hypothetical protein